MRLCSEDVQSGKRILQILDNGPGTHRFWATALCRRCSVYSEEGLVQGFFMGQMAWCRSHSQAEYMVSGGRLGGDSINRVAHQKSSATLS